jgi:Cu+-exporting ATPase
MNFESVSSSPVQVSNACFHCGAPLRGDALVHDGRSFCCAGCRTVYEILSKNAMCEYYDFEKSPGRVPSLRPAPKYAFLDDPSVAARLLQFSNDEMGVADLLVPGMHCSSCIWLLENLQRLDAGVLFSRADFMRKRVFVRFSTRRTSLRKVVELLASLGYEPELNLGTDGSSTAPPPDRSLYIRLGVAGFSFGNIMLFSLPEYFDPERTDLASRQFFAYLNLLLAAPAVGYGAWVFFRSAFQGLRRRIVNIDVPIAIGIGLVFLRSAADVLLQTGPGYFDSLTGLIFFLLLGRLFQSKTYESLNFERTYRSYFPLAVTVRKEGMETTVPITALRPGDRIVLRNREVVPADAVVMEGDATVDYAFVTGEAAPEPKRVGEVVYAGGRQTGGAVELEVVKEPAASRFVQMWDSFGGATDRPGRLLTLSTTVGRWFTGGILLLAAATAAGWWLLDPTRILDAVTAVLIVACPCALALAAPFTFGTAMRLLGRRGFYLRNAAVVEAMAGTDTVVFDKTGTLTEPAASRLRFVGEPLAPSAATAVASLARGSSHPLSRRIAAHLGGGAVRPVSEFREVEGEGVSGVVDGLSVALGSAAFAGTPEGGEDPEVRRTRVYVSVDGRPAGRFDMENRYRAGAARVLGEMGNDRRIHLLSGDGDGERARLGALYPGFTSMLFRHAPAEKREAVRVLQQGGGKVLMFGDGLNDAGALKQSDVGVAVTEDVGTFSPACDAILDAKEFGRAGAMVLFARTAMLVVYAAIAISLVYNVLGLWFAVRAELSPLMAAVLMPLSSITVVLFSTGVTTLLARRRGLA